MTEQPTVQEISDLLTEAGFTKSGRSRLDGRSAIDVTEGFRVRYDRRHDAVLVRHILGETHGAASQVRESKKLAAYTEWIRDAGYRVQQDQIWHSVALIVTALPEAKDANSDG